MQLAYYGDDILGSPSVAQYHSSNYAPSERHSISKLNQRFVNFSMARHIHRPTHLTKCGQLSRLFEMG